MGVAADVVGQVVEAFLGPATPLWVRCWDDSTWGDPSAPLRVSINSPRAIRRLVWDPDELGLARAYIAGDLDFEGSAFDLLALRDAIAGRNEDVALSLTPQERLRLLGAAIRHGWVGTRPAPPPEEARLRGRLHSRRRDHAAISHHYDVGNDFYRIVLGPTMTYSCALFSTADTTLDEAQELKYEHICRKLALQPGQRLLDIGCGWGGMLLHAARHHGVEGVGVTLSREQAASAARRVSEAGLDSRIEIRLQDYRDVDDGPFDAVSSIGMFEHVGMSMVQAYFGQVRRLLVPRGRLLNHAISRTAGEGALERDSFVARYVFPDGHLHEVGRTVSCLQDGGLECRDVESLREHYARTLRCWVANLEADWARCVQLAGPAKARIWRLYMAASALAFEAHRVNIHQVLAVNTAPDGASGFARTRPDTPLQLARRRPELLSVESAKPVDRAGSR